MKVGILTFPNSISYGATLQMYALYQSVKRLGHDAEVINYYSEYMKSEKHYKKPSESKYKQTLKKIIRNALYAHCVGGFRSFEKHNLTLYPHKYFSDASKLSSLGDRYDAVICGSDQVWNPDITGNDLSYFLDFCGKKTRRVSYAPSFGVDVISEPMYSKAAHELQRFHALSVRETSGQFLIKQMIGKEAALVVDPTFLLDKSDWEMLEKRSTAINEKYILYFTVSSSETLFEKSRKFAEQNGLKLIVIGGGIKKQLKKDAVVRYMNDVTPQTWLWLIHHADYVVTNSFHGTAFSIIYEKDFYLELSSYTNSRLSNIVNITNLSDRIVAAEDDIIPAKADYTAAKSNISQLRESSINFLKQALEDTCACEHKKS